MAMGNIQGYYFIWPPSSITSYWLPDNVECGRFADPPVPSLLQKGDTHTHTHTHVVATLVGPRSQSQHHRNLRVCMLCIQNTSPTRVYVVYPKHQS